MQIMPLLKKVKDGWTIYYWPTEEGCATDIYPLWLLLDQWGLDSERIISAIKKYDSFSTDLCHIDKEDEFAILENHQFSDKEDLVRLKIPLENLYDILRKWEKLEKAGPEEIILEFDGEKVSISSVE